ncbi:MAG TPA: hypothetical protein VFB67_08180 [Candidatus Polarisedimenticolaceae bacterium]|nr:hypothetical protein [Candidatus Polarisedimenticolaceae bacterium]
MPRKPLLKVSPESEGGGKGLLRVADGEEAVRIDALEPHVELTRRRRDHGGEEEAGEVVGDHQACLGGERAEEPAAGPRLRLDVRDIVDPRGAAPPGVVTHAVHHEPVEPFGGEGVVASKRLQDDEGLPEGDRRLHCALKAEIPARAPSGDHPVDDAAALRAERRVVGHRDADRGDGHCSGIRPRIPTTWPRLDRGANRRTSDGSGGDRCGKA